MISYDEAFKIVMDHVTVNGLETTDLMKAAGRILREDVRADMDNPPFTNSAMDGYAVRAQDTAGASPERPVTLKVVGEAPAGAGIGLTIHPGEAAAIMTGGPLPEGADSIVIVEETKRSGADSVAIFKPSKKDNHVRFKGEDIRSGEIVVSSGTLITPPIAALLATFGKSRITVSAKPRIAILSTGNELVEPSVSPAPGQIRNSNAYYLFSCIERNGGSPVYCGIARDDKSDTEKKISAAFKNADILITTGGVSVGEYDFVKEILEKIGVTLHFTRVAIKPGRPLTFGTKDHRLFFGLPGNPVSTMVTFNLFVMPAITKMCGRYSFERVSLPCILEEDVRLAPGRRNFIRFMVRKEGDRLMAKSTGRQDSGRLRSIAFADGIASFPQEMKTAKKGSIIHVELI